MADSIYIASGTKAEMYESILPQIKGLMTGEDNLIANMANVSAALFAQFGWLWVGFYIVEKEELVLGPFQGPIACTRIKKGRGVCGKAWQDASTIIVDDVEAFPGHIACSSDSRSEIVVPIYKGDEIIAVLDCDSTELSHYDETDKLFLEKVAELFK